MNDWPIKDIPHSSKIELKNNLATVHSIVKVPDYVVASVEVNEVARKHLPPELQYMCTKEYLLAHTYITVPHGEENVKRRNILGMNSWGRALAVRYGYIPYTTGNRITIGGVHTIKGCNLSGVEYRNAIAGDRVEPTKHRPIGQFGTNDSEKETTISMQLLESGYDSTLPLGRVILKPQGYRSFICELWRDSKNKNSIRKALQFVEKNGDEPTIIHRVQGVQLRIDTSVESYSYVNDQMIINKPAQRYLLHQATRGLELINRRVDYDPRIDTPDKLLLTQFADAYKNGVNPILINGISVFLGYQAATDIAAIRNLLTLYPGNFNSIHALNILMQQKDICFALQKTDYEELDTEIHQKKMTPDINYLIEHATGVLRSIYMNEYIQKLYQIITLHDGAFISRKSSGFIDMYNESFNYYLGLFESLRG